MAIAKNREMKLTSGRTRFQTKLHLMDEKNLTEKAKMQTKKDKWKKIGIDFVCLKNVPLYRLF